MPTPPAKKGRASAFNTPNRFEQLHLEPDPLELDDEDYKANVPTQYLVDSSKSILAENSSPDIDFRYSLNPYRGCEHGCAYCFARPTHEYLGFSAGLDFETRILVKENAPELLRQTFRKKSWTPQVVALSGNTDCYQPVERRLEITRRCLEVFLEFRNPVTIITKNALVTRDLDILRELAALDLVHVTLSVTSLKRPLTAVMEPRTSRPEKRLAAIADLHEAGVPVGVMVAPLIPGLNDEEMPNILEAAAGKGAQWAGYIMVRLPGAVKPLFIDWVQRNMPDRAGKIVSRLQAVRDGELSDPRFGSRLRGEGELADVIASFFHLSRRRQHLENQISALATDLFRRSGHHQLSLFDP
ncbi:MAG: PA0069 family radical SAM protein [Candidatus Latescibacteria bacterium]|jgi:DNA repair photolyase|nr:radical SAM protein [Gemmatimonadaceae bacterium]MDP6017242.1 PA0069 family radical SAM protein [Candidatus Latescibacterota bacterium]MDP7447979.1 PA0069 family radical SAM protein [Candidatus Latescibacterota bacterium]HJP30452.1 PA0069 family radical SAM protein [Candidatus Latescibacterota bacterium]|tara:strand:+ start:131 stop:1198 length:1068 start_codon:yes stop_codon:yes gene_type:complete